MNKFIISAAILLMGIIGINAQSPQTANEFGTGYSFLTRENEDAHGFYTGYTRYVNGSVTKAGTVGVTGEVAANFDSDEASLATLQGGLTFKARNSKVIQPSVRFLAGVARQRINRLNTPDTTDVSGAFTVGGGLDIPLGKASRLGEVNRYKLHFGADLVNTGFGGQRQNGARLSAGVTF